MSTEESETYGELPNIKPDIDAVTEFLSGLAKHFGFSLDYKDEFYYLPDVTTADEAAIVRLAGWLSNFCGPSNAGKSICDSIAECYHTPYVTVKFPCLN